ncbi:MAG: hypothetical protein ACPIA7_02650 [Akkermansiaceae bacterium]
MKIFCSLMFISVSLFSLSSCNTFIGFGRDIERLGEGMQNKADGKTWSGNERHMPADSPY